MRFHLVTGIAVFAFVACGGGGGGGNGGGGGVTQPGATTGSIRGNVTEGNGNAIANASVGLSGNSQPARTTTTSSTGSYSFTSVPPGPYTVTVTPPSGFNLGGGAATASVTVVAGQEAAVNAFVLARNQAPVAVVDVSMANLAFSPASVNVPIGGAVRFTNNDGVTHNATATVFATGNINAGSSRQTEVLNTAGTFPYQCTLHAGMTGTIVVQ